jgi:hypothetical protein
MECNKSLYGGLECEALSTEVYSWRRIRDGTRKSNELGKVYRYSQSVERAIFPKGTVKYVRCPFLYLSRPFPNYSSLPTGMKSLLRPMHLYETSHQVENISSVVVKGD